MIFFQKLKTNLFRTDRRLWVILVVAAFFIFFKINHADLLGDDAHYSVRSIGLVDFMFADVAYQSTPLQWFEVLPWWSRLSFHDHPLVIFIIQRLFLGLHVSIFFAKLPYALMALGTIALTYSWCKKVFNNEVGLLAALLLALNAHFIWFGRSAFMESGVLFAISLAWYFFVHFLSDQKYFWQWGLTFGLMLESKFTTFFAAAAMLVYILVKERRLLRSRKLYYALGIAGLVFLPQVIYNVAMQVTTGHFALQLARLLGQESPWHLAGVSAAPWRNILGIFTSLAGLISWPTLIVSGVALVYVLWRRSERWLFGLPIFFLLLEDLTIGSKDLWAIFLSPIVAIAFYDIYQKIKVRPLFKYIGWAAVSMYAVYLFIFLVMSHVSLTHRGSVGLLHSTVTSDNFGMVQLDTYLDTVVREHPELTRLDFYDDLKVKQSNLHPFLVKNLPEKYQGDLNKANIIVFDDRINWFSRVWLFERRRFYDNLPVISVAEDYLLNQLKLNSFYFVKAESGAAFDSISSQSKLAHEMEEKLVKLEIKPDSIYRDDGQVAFKVYYVAEGIK